MDKDELPNNEVLMIRQGGFVPAFTIFIYLHSSAANPSSFQNSVGVSDASKHLSLYFLAILFLNAAYSYALCLLKASYCFVIRAQPTLIFAKSK